MNLQQHVLEPTHVSGHMSDLVISRATSTIVRSTSVECFLTDHPAVHCCLNIKKQSHPKQEIIYRKTKAINHNKFSQDLQESELICNPKENLDELVKQYDTVLHSILDKHAPEQKRFITVRSPRPWYNDDITEAKKLRKQLERRWRRTQTNNDRTAFKIQRNIVTDMIKEARKKYYKIRIAESSDPKKFFCIIEELLHKKGQPKVPSHTSPAQLSENFIDYFSTKISMKRP